MKKRIMFLILIASFMLGCQTTSKHALVLDYDDFGPQAMAWETIGMEWWQWDSHGNDNPDKQYPIHVVVYRDIKLEEVKSLYPVDKEKEQDYRYIEFNEAIQYLQKHIRELEDREEEWAILLRQELKDTERNINNRFQR